MSLYLLSAIDVFANEVELSEKKYDFSCIGDV